MRSWADKTEIKATKLVRWIGISRSKYYQWQDRYGKVNEHNHWIPRDFWLVDEEKRLIIDYYQENPLEGYRRLTYMMIDNDIVAVSPSSVYRVLKYAGLLDRWNRKKSKKGTGFKQPLGPHVRTSPFYPQSNGKLERYHKTIKGDCIRVKTLLSLEDARDAVADFVDNYNNERLHSAIGYVTPNDKLQGRSEEIYARREEKLTAARDTQLKATNCRWGGSYNQTCHPIVSSKNTIQSFAYA